MCDIALFLKDKGTECPMIVPVGVLEMMETNFEDAAGLIGDWVDNVHQDD